MTSARLTPAATTSTSTWPGPASGSGTSARTRLSASPGSGIVMARMGPTLLTGGHRVHRDPARAGRVGRDVPHASGPHDTTVGVERGVLVEGDRAGCQTGGDDRHGARDVAPLRGMHVDGARHEAEPGHDRDLVEVLVALLGADGD